LIRLIDRLGFATAQAMAGATERLGVATAQAMAGARTIGASWTPAAKVTLAGEAVSAFVAAANIVSVEAEVAKAIVNGYFGMSV
jgi:hypothetical protein